MIRDQSSGAIVANIYVVLKHRTRSLDLLANFATMNLHHA